MLYEFGSFRLDAIRRRLVSLGDGTTVTLTAKALDTLLYLVEHRHEVIEKSSLMSAVWPNVVVEENNLNQTISMLRRALGEGPRENRYIATLPGRGYQFVADVTTLTDAERNNEVSAAPPAAAATGPASVSIPSRELDSIAARRRRIVGAGAVVGGAAIALGIVAVLIRTAPTRESTADVAPARPAVLKTRLAVLPFENLSPDPANAFFADGMHEEILSTFANRATNMDVISRTTMMSYRGRPTTVGALAKALGVTHVLEGSVRREGQTVRVSLKLIEADSDRNVWSHSYDRELVNVMLLQSQVAAEVASQLAVKLSPSGDERPRSASPAAYDLYLKARLASQGIVISTPVEELDRVESWLTRAIELDPSFAAAYVERAHIRIFKFGYSHDLTERNLEAIRADIRTAGKLAGDAAAVLQLQSRYANAVEMDLNKALALIERPAMVASREPTVMRWRAFVLNTAGQTDEALALYARVAQLDPGNQTNFFSWTLALKRLGRPAEAIAVARSFNEHGPGRVYFGDIEFAFAGRLERLREDFERMGDSIDPDARLVASFDLLRFERRFDELQALLSRATAPTFRPAALRETPVPGLGTGPVAELRGWTALLLNDKAAAANEGRVLLDFVAQEPVTPWNRWHLRGLAAEGALFVGDKARAISEARAALATVPTHRSNQRRYAYILTARVLAWAGAENDALRLLEELSTRSPRLGPAEVTRDPLYSVPLADNGRYQTLVNKLETEIAANQRRF